jgi:hypothetical protein
MKVLNRPMFRMGGPIKEGIMSGIKEPRQGYRLGKGVDRTAGGEQSIGGAQMVFPAEITSMMPNNAAKVFADVSKIYEPPVDQNINTTDRYITVDRKKPRSNEIQTVQIENPDFVPKYRIIKHPRFGEKKVEITEDMENITGKASGTDMPPMLDQSGKMGAGTIGVDATKDNTNPIPEKTREEKVNTILEGLGYDRAQKNALYDAMIKAGQRISRTGLGAENLVSDVIAETSQSYDKPEKLREAANLMQVQQDLKLDQIEAGKTNTTEQTVDFLMSDKGGNKTKTEALDIVLKNPRNDDEAYDKAFAETKGDVGRAVTAAVNYAVKRNLFDKPLGIIDTKKYDNPKEFFEDKTVYKGPGNYIIGGTVIEIDSKGNATTVKKYYTSKKSESFLAKFGIGTD